jgi:DNA-binding MarR family transcriptional regulator
MPLPEFGSRAKLVNVVAETVNQIDEFRKGDPPGYELPLLLFSGFRRIIEALHVELARQGHPDLRPAHGFALQAVGPDGVTATELGRRLGVSKQAAGKTVDRLERAGYVERVNDTADGRRKVIRLTPRGVDSLVRSAAIFDRLRAEWAGALGPAQLAALEDGLRRMLPAEGVRLDAASWFSG